MRGVPKPVRSAAPAAGVSKPVRRSRAVEDVSDLEEGIVVSARRVRKGNGPVRNVKDTATDRRASISPAPETERASRTAHKDGESVSRSALLDDDIELESSEESIEMSRRARPATSAVDTSRLSMANFRRRPRQPSILGRGPGRGRSSSLESNIAEDNGLMSVGRRNNAAGFAAQGHRARRGSVSGQNAHLEPASSVGMEMQKATPAHGGSVLNVGNFRRRAREPSILGTGRKKMRPETEDEGAGDDQDEQEDEDDFNPEDASTPLRMSKTRTSTGTSGAGESSNSRKRKLSTVPAPLSISSTSSRSASPELPEPEPLRPADIDAENESDAPSLPSSDPVPSIERRPSTPELYSETMAPPLSSSSSTSSPEPALPLYHQPSRGRRLARGRTPLHTTHTHDSPMSSPPSLTHSPNRPPGTLAARQRQARAVPPPSTYSTAQLQQTLMPRRRRRVNARVARDPFDIPSSDDREVDTLDLDSSADELSHLAARARSKRSKTPAATTSKRAKAPAGTSKNARPGKTTASKSTSTGKRTYGSTTAVTTSDKENDGTHGTNADLDLDPEVDPDDSLAPLPDDDPENSQELEERVGRELKIAARKFAEVDRWEMEFEDVSGEGSSPAGRR